MTDSFTGVSSDPHAVSNSLDASAAEGLSIRMLHTSICNWQSWRARRLQSSLLGLRFGGDTRAWVL